jgi:hypothetical protein
MSWIERVILYLTVGAVIALATDARAQFGATAVYNTNTGAGDTINVTWDVTVAPGTPDGGYSSAVHIYCAGSPSGCNYDAGVVHPGTTVIGGVSHPSCSDCAGGTSYISHGGVTTMMPCFSGGVLTWSSGSTGSGSGTVTWTGGTVTRQDQGTGGGGTVGGNVHIEVGPSTCTSPVHVTGHWAGGAPHGAGVVANIIVGGYLVQVQCDANGCNSGDVPAHALMLTGGFPTNVEGGLMPGSWAICGVEGSRYLTTPTMDALPSTVACGGTVDAAIHSNCSSPTPTPDPSPSASVAPSPSTTPVITPPPTPSSTPLQYPTPPPNNPGTGVTNGGTTGSGISNQDIYNDVKQALDDAGTRDSHFGVPNGGFGFGNDPSGENGTAGNGLQSAVDRFTGDLHGGSDSLMGYVDSIDSLDLPTGIGDKKTWNVSLPVLGDITVDTTPYDTPVGILRALCLAILIVCAWFAMIRIIRSGVA